MTSRAVNELPPKVPLRRAVLWAGAGGGVYVVCQYGMLMAIAKLGTSLDVGHFALAQAIATPAIVLSQMQLRQLQVTDVREEYSFAQYMGMRTMTSAIAVVAIVLIALTAGFDRTMFAVVVVIGLAKALESVGDTAHGALQKAERMDLIARALALKGLLSLAALILALWLTRDLLIAVLAMTGVWGVVLLTYELRLAKSTLPAGVRLLRFDRASARSLAAMALPLSVASGVGSLSANIPRYFLKAMHGTEAVGLFAIAAAPLVLLGVTNTAISQATLARAASYYDQREWAAFSRVSRRIALLQIVAAAMLAAVLLLAGGPLMRSLFTAEYEAAAPVAAVMACGVMVGGIGAWGATVITAGRRFHLQLWNVLVLVIAQVPLCFILIGPYGVAGAGWSEFFRYALSALFLVAAGAHVYQRQRNAAQPSDRQVAWISRF